ncbi:hypothetical protein P7C70_g4933, partial [Phenoliferia sp. Uapishka_3]
MTTAAVEIDYEGLDNDSIAINMLAGAMAGIAEHAVMFPVDMIKTRMQVLATSPQAVYTGMGDAFTRITSLEGGRRLWRGVASVIMGAGPAHAVYFGTYELAKEFAGGNANGYSFAATVASCFRSVYKAEGLNAFYVSYPTTLMMTVPFTAVQFSTYEYLKEIFNPSSVYSPLTHVTAGGIAGGVAAAVTTPLDICKTLLQTRGASEDHTIRTARGMGDAFKIIYSRQGLSGFTRGMAPRVLANMPSNALCWLSYEGFRFLLKGSPQPSPRRDAQ